MNGIVMSAFDAVVIRIQNNTGINNNNNIMVH